MLYKVLEFAAKVPDKDLKFSFTQNPIPPAKEIFNELCSIQRDHYFTVTKTLSMFLD